MIKVPSYLECFAKFVSFLGLDYCEGEKTTAKFRTAELRDFSEQGDRYTKDYIPKILNLFAGEDKKKQEAIKVLIMMSESIARFLTSKNYYTIASNKRATWALLVYYYIPHLACIISFYKEGFGIPVRLIESDFMLPYADAGKIILPTERLRELLKPIKKTVPTQKNTENNFLAKYLDKFDKTKIPSYQTQQKIVNQLKSIVASDAEIDEIRLLFRTAIVSGRIYNELLGLFGDEAYALALVEYFKKCLKTSDRFIQEDISPNDSFEYFFELYVDYYQIETFYTAAELNRSITCDFEALKDEREGYRERLLVALNAFLYTTTSATLNQLDEIDMVNLTKGILRFRDLEELEEGELLDEEHQEIVNLLTQLDYIYSYSDNILNESEINLIFDKILKNKYYLNYDHEVLLFAGLNHLAKNEFFEAIEKINMARKRCNEITAGETLVRAASLLIVLRLLTDNKISYAHLNSEIKMIIDLQPEESLMVFYPSDTEKEINQNIYFEKVINLITTFNSEGYCHYRSVECVKYNPFEKLEAFIGDIFILFDNPEFFSGDEEMKMVKVIEKLMKSKNAKYPIEKNLVTLYQYTASEVFTPLNFTNIYLFIADSKFESTNILKLLNDHPMLALITEAFEKIMPNPDKRARSSEQGHVVL